MIQFNKDFFQPTPEGEIEKLLSSFQEILKEYSEYSERREELFSLDNVEIDVQNLDDEQRMVLREKLTKLRTHAEYVYSIIPTLDQILKQIESLNSSHGSINGLKTHLDLVKIGYQETIDAAMTIKEILGE